MTEDEAKTKICCGPPWVSSSAIVATGKDGKRADALAFGRCIGSGCMAWRWDDPWTSQTEEGVGGDLVIRLARKQGEPKLGYCGLAGAVR